MTIRTRTKYEFLFKITSESTFPTTCKARTTMNGIITCRVLSCSENEADFFFQKGVSTDFVFFALGVKSLVNRMQSVIRYPAAILEQMA